MIDKIANLLGGGVLGGANKLAKTFFGSAESRDTADHDETIAFLQGVSNQMKPRRNRTWWDSLVDGH